jgi:adenylate kinase
MESNKRYIFLGPPGSGKGTQAKVVADKLGLPHIDMGSTIRAAIGKGTEAGKKAKEYVESGQLVPSDIVIAMAEERLKQNDTENGFILDGYPRSLSQAEALEKYLKVNKLNVKVLNLNIPVENVVERLSSRLMCRGCSDVYNTKTKPPKRKGVCDSCNSELYVRADDNPETIKNRFKTYEDETAPLIGFYSKKGALINIDASGDIDRITKNILDAIS